MNNFEKIQQAIKNSDMEALILTSPSNRRYAAGFSSTSGVCVVTEEKSYFFIDSRYFEAAEKEVQGAEVRIVGGKTTYYDVINKVIAEHDAKVVGFEENSLTVARFRAYEEKLHAKLVPAQKILDDLRAVKSEDELKLMIQAQRIAEKSFCEVLGLINTEMTERELVTELVYRMMKNGAEDKSFDPIVVSGRKSSIPHGEAGNEKIGKGFLTIDFGAKYKGYCSDTTRTLCIGKPTDEMVKVYHTVLEAQLAGIAEAKAGKAGAEIDGAARRIIKDAGYGEYFGHAFSHSLGIDIHEVPTCAPSSKDMIPAGAVISAEPGIYIPGKFGVRIEDVLFITETGSRNITNLPKELIVL